LKWSPTNDSLSGRPYPLKSVYVSVLAAALLIAPSPAVSQATGSGQLIRSGDVIRLKIWREPDMSGEYIVDEAGTVVFPRVGEYNVLGDTNASLQGRLLADYQRYLRNPSIDIIVLRRIGIIGSVNQPGLKLVDPTVTISDALALAGGATPLGDPNKIRILRDGQEIAVEVGADMRLSDSPIRSGDQLFVPERSWISRNSGVVATGISASVALIIAVFIR
jgi:protein involved in polysaccharide export with SLBB domain